MIKYYTPSLAYSKLLSSSSEVPEYYKKQDYRFPIVPTPKLPCSLKSVTEILSYDGVNFLARNKNRTIYYFGDDGALIKQPMIYQHGESFEYEPYESRMLFKAFDTYTKASYGEIVGCLDVPPTLGKVLPLFSNSISRSNKSLQKRGEPLNSVELCIHKEKSDQLSMRLQILAPSFGSPRGLHSWTSFGLSGFLKHGTSIVADRDNYDSFFHLRPMIRSGARIRINRHNNSNDVILTWSSPSYSGVAMTSARIVDD
jgi:hypothetical protein